DRWRRDLPFCALPRLRRRTGVGAHRSIAPDPTRAARREQSPLHRPEGVAMTTIPLDAILGDGTALLNTRTSGEGPTGSLPIDADTLRDAPSGHLFGMTQNAGMGWRAAEVARDPYLIVSTQGGLRAEDGQPVALGSHPGQWALDRRGRTAANPFAARGALPFSVACSDPCDGRTQGTVGMFDSLPYRNDAAVVMRRLVRSLPTR